MLGYTVYSSLFYRLLFSVHRFAKGSQGFGDVFLHGVGADAEPLRSFPIGEVLVEAQPQHCARWFGQASGDGFRFLQQGFVFPVVALHVDAGGFAKRLYVFLFHLQMLQAVEAAVADGGVYPAAAVALVQSVEVLPCLFHDFAYDVPRFFAVAHQLRGIAHHSRIHFRKHLPEGFSLCLVFMEQEH